MAETPESDQILNGKIAAIQPIALQFRMWVHYSSTDVAEVLDLQLTVCYYYLLISSTAVTQ